MKALKRRPEPTASNSSSDFNANSLFYSVQGCLRRSVHGRNTKSLVLILHLETTFCAVVHLWDLWTLQNSDQKFSFPEHYPAELYSTDLSLEIESK